MTVRCVALDVDDTLYLEREYVRSGFGAVGAWLESSLGATGFAERAWARFLAGARGSTFDEVLPTLGVVPTPELVAQLVDVYRGHRPDIALLADAAACLERFERADVALAVVTDGPLASQQAKVDALGLTARVAIVVLTESYGAGFGKPHRRAFEAVEAAVGVSGDACAYVADNPAKDFGGPRSLGWRTVRVRRPESLHVDVPSGDDVDDEVDDLWGLDAALGLEPAP